MINKEQYINKIINGDCLNVMKELPDETYDLIITSPPYNLRAIRPDSGKKSYGRFINVKIQNGYNTYSDDLPYDEYYKWQNNCLKEMYRLLKPTGAIFYNHKYRIIHNKLMQHQDIFNDLPIRQIIIWQRSGGINFNNTYFVPTYELIFMIPKPNYQLKNKANGLGDIWKIHQGTDKCKEHPASYPLEIPNRIIKSSENNSLVLDPFMGSGTTAIACIQNDVQYTGIEISEKYCELANKQINNIISFDKNLW